MLTVKTLTLEYMVGYQEISGTDISKDDSSWPINTILSSSHVELIRLPVLLQISLACTTGARTHAMTVPQGQPNGNWVSPSSLGFWRLV